MSFYSYCNKRQTPSMKLSPRQLEVLFWSLHCLSIREIAGKLGLTIATCGTHFREGLRKLGIQPPKIHHQLLTYRE